jgi:hypothetical protein
MSRNILIKLWFLVFVVSSCSSSNCFKTEKIGDENQLKETSLVYALPRTKIIFYVDVVRHTKIPGPYYMYANKYLGVGRVIDHEEVNYKIADFKHETIKIPDPNEYYRVEAKRSVAFIKELMEYSDMGYLITDLYSNYTIDKSDKAQAIDFKYKDLSMSSNFYYSFDTLYKTVLTDSAFVKLPVIKSQYNEKTMDQKAREVSELIINLRKERYRIITEALESSESAEMFTEILNKIGKLEKDYMALFEGKSFSENLHYVFSIVPEIDSTGVFETDICCFSHQQGIMPKRTGCNKLKARLTNLNKVTNLDMLVIEMDDKPLKNKIYYRLPVQARLEVIYNNDLLFESMVSVSQSGKILPIQLIRE